MIDDFRKQIELIDVENFKKPIHVIGCGALGSWVVFFLVKMGFKNINVYDFDNIEEHNLPNQLFFEAQIGKPKVESIYEIARGADYGADVSIHNKKLLPGNLDGISGIVFCCVDSMRTRRMLYKELFLKDKIEMFIEGRLSIYGAYIFTLKKEEKVLFSDAEQYEKTLYADEEAEVSACGVSQTALPAAVNAATIMIMQMICDHNGDEIYPALRYSIPHFTVIDKW